MDTALRARTWEDEYNELYCQIQLDYFITEAYMTNENAAKQIDRICDTIRDAMVPTYESIQFGYYEHSAEIIHQMALLLCKNDENYAEEFRLADEDGKEEMIDEMIAGIYDSLSYSGEMDRIEVLILSCIVRKINCLLTDEDAFNLFYGSFDMPQGIMYSVGDAQNSLFPQFLEKTNAEICNAIGFLDFALQEPIDLRLVALRKPNNNLRIGGEAGWQH